MAATVYTIGHSTRPIEEFIRMLKAYGITLVVDVRTIPKSRFNPQYNSDTLQKSLAAAGIGYLLESELGGLRHTTKTSVNTGWKNASFRGYADYMQTDEFKRGVQHLIALATEQPTVIMCAEAVPWRCHRSLIGDALLVRKVEVKDIMGEDAVREHTLTSFAKVRGLRITYPLRKTGDKK